MQDAKPSFQQHGLGSRRETARAVRPPGPREQTLLGVGRQCSELVLLVAGQWKPCGGRLSPSLYHLCDINQQHGTEGARLFLEVSYNSEFQHKQLKIDLSSQHSIHQVD